jgi:hypothetical protein
MAKSNFLTKSRFKIGYECPTKLYYQDDQSYGNTNSENSFLKALAEGGFQVGELAKIYHPGGTEILTDNKDQAAAETAELLKQDNVVIYEAAFKYENLFIKADIVVKRGPVLELIEVKAKSFDKREEDPFYNKTSLKKGNPKLSSSWEPYLIDVAFQKYVINKSFPQFQVASFLMLADKTSVATVDGINQKFFLEKNDKGRVHAVTKEGVTTENLGEKLLIKISVDTEVQLVWNMSFDDNSFYQLVESLSEICQKQLFSKPQIGSKCKSCEFRISKEMKGKGLRSGFEKCWSDSAGLKQNDFQNSFVFEVWNFRKAANLIAEGKYFINQLDQDDVSPTAKAGECGLSSSERQWLQVEKNQNNDDKAYIDHSGLSAEMNSWRYPLHFIDFETTMVAIPFHKGRRPYELIAFQFSHHLVTENGKIIHQDEYINNIKGAFPNFEFVRALMKALSNDEGTIFRYANHENTVLRQIRQQILEAEEFVEDRDQLITFIDSITQAKEEDSKKKTGSRNMVDMCELVKKYFYHPLTKGSNSIKSVLPAILKESKYLQEKYSNPIYGTENFIVSKNFKNWQWIQLDEKGNVKDPYKILPPVFSDIDVEEMDSLITDASLADGGAAMTAYARMQFTEMSKAESEAVTKALLKYCELDTLAMVMIFEYWKHEVDVAMRTVA